jgi:Ca2+-transporting ATPase
MTDLSSAFTGLASAQVRERLAGEGFNELPQAHKRTLLRIFLEVLREPMLLLLLGGGAVYLALGDLREALLLLVFASLSVVITLLQETRTERVLETLRDLSSPRALVIRDGIQQRIAGREVVRGDLIVLGEGDRVPADALLLRCQDLQVDESLLTGESVPVRKALAAGPVSGVIHPGGEDLPQVWSGTLVVRGSGLAEVSATGERSELGRIGRSLKDVEREAPRLQAQMRRIVRVFGAAGALVSLAALILYGLLRGGWLEALLAAIAIGMSLLPEEFPVVLTVFMAMGAWRIARARVLTRRAASIETLGAATVLCTDKTGTLTLNRMSIVELRPAEGGAPGVSEDATRELSGPRARLLLLHGVLASAVQVFDPMDRAFHDLAAERLGDDATLPQRWQLVRTYGLRPELLAVTQVWQPDTAQSQWQIAAKGAPEAIAALCGVDYPAAMREAVDAMAASGQRVLAVARAAFAGPALPDSPQGFDFEFLGLVGLADPVRPEVPAAVRECQSAGIRVVMITGDYPLTARAIARQAGIANDGDALAGTEIDRLSPEALAARARVVSVFARVSPAQKLRIVEALKADGQIVAMTGDGVNDAPSLKAAHIGIAMGRRGTDVAREVASMVLLEDDFGSIVAAIRLGRRIYDNLRKAMGFIFAAHVPIAGLALLPLVLDLPLLFGPVHIAFLEMVIDPVCSLVFEAEQDERDVMQRPPRPPAQPLFSRSLIAWSLLQGLVVFVLVAAIFLVAHSRGMADEAVRALGFLALVLCMFSLILVNRSFSTSLLRAVLRPNRLLLVVLGLAGSILVLSMTWRAARELFGFAALGGGAVALAFAAAVTTLGVLEFAKRFWRERLRR